MTTRKTKAKKLTASEEDWFRKGVVNSRWRSNADKGAFTKTRLEMKRINDERSAEMVRRINESELSVRLGAAPLVPLVMLQKHNVYLEGEILNRICAEIIEAMPYLECYTDHRHKAYFFHRGTDFSVGYVTSIPGYCMKQWGLFSPLTSDKMRGGVSTDYEDKVVSLARKYFKYAPPDNMHPFIAWNNHNRDILNAHNLYKNKTVKIDDELRDNFRRSVDASKESYNFFNDLFLHKPEFMERSFPTIYNKFVARTKKLERLNEEIRRISNIAYVMVDSANEGRLTGKALVITHPAQQVTLETIHDLEQVNSIAARERSRVWRPNTFPAPRPCEIPPELVVSIAQLNMDELNRHGEYDFVEGVGQRVSTNEYLVYYNVPMSGIPDNLAVQGPDVKEDDENDDA
jgi:hypothetical protein